jgi:hypothetical protein
MLRGTARTGVGVVQIPEIIVRSVSHSHLLEAALAGLTCIKPWLRNHPLKR